MITLLVCLTLLFGTKGWIGLYVVILGFFLLLTIAFFAWFHWELTSDHTYHQK